MANYTKTTDFAAKDTLPGGDTNKVVRGTEFETEFDAISTAIATKSDTAGPTFTGTVTIPTADINGGNIDGTVIGASSAAAGTFTNLTASGTVNFNGATISNLGTITTANLDGGTIDNAVIGGSTAAAGSFTTVAASSSITVGGAAVLTTVTFSNLDAGAVTTSSETFTDSDTQIPTNAAVKAHVAAVTPTLSVTESSVTAHQAALAIAATQLTGNITVPGNVRLAPSGTNFTELYGNTNAGAIRFNCESNSHGVTIKGPPHSATATYTLELPNADGTAGQLLKTDGSGKLSFTTVNASPTFTATASGALANGDLVIVNSNGTVSAISATSVSVSETIGTAAVFESADSYDISIAYDVNAQKVVIVYVDSGNSYYGTAVVGTVSGTSISFGTPVVFETATTSFTSVAYDANAQKVVIAYRDYGNSNYGTAIVGTVSGTSISFGSAVVFESANSTQQSIAYDANAQKVVIAYQDQGNSSYGTAIVGTVSGTSISFGTAVVFESANSDHISAVYDSNAQKIVITYRDVGNSYNGTAIVGTVSGTSISFGSATVFETADTAEISSVYDSTAQKVVIAYRHGEVSGGDTGYGTAIVGTVSGTSISFGTAATFESALTNYTSAVYDSNAQRVVIAYEDDANSDYGTIVVGTVSGTSISFGSPSVFESASTEYIAAVYDSNAQRVVVSYRDAGNSNHGTAFVYQTPYTATNLTAENYIGISDAAYSDTATATIQIVGSVDDAQSSLTAGQKYFVQPDGSLGLTASDPEVFAGTAVSATKLIVKG